AGVVVDPFMAEGLVRAAMGHQLRCALRRAGDQRTVEGPDEQGEAQNEDRRVSHKTPPAVPGTGIGARRRDGKWRKVSGAGAAIGALGGLAGLLDKPLHRPDANLLEGEGTADEITLVEVAARGGEQRHLLRRVDA